VAGKRERIGFRSPSSEPKAATRQENVKHKKFRPILARPGLTHRTSFDQALNEMGTGLDFIADSHQRMLEGITPGRVDRDRAIGAERPYDGTTGGALPESAYRPA